MNQSSASSGWLHWVAGIGGTVALLAIVGYLANDDTQPDGSGDPRAKGKVGRGQRLSGRRGAELTDPGIEKLLNAARLARKNQAWPEASKFALEATRLMERHPAYRDSLSFAEIHFILFEISTIRSKEGLDSAGQYHLEQSRLAVDRVKDIQNPTIHTQIKALVYSNLAELYVQKGEFERAEPLGEVSVALLEEAIFKDSPDNLNVAICKSSLGVAKQQLKKYEAAEVLFRSAYDIYMKMGTPDESNVIECVTRLGTVLMALDRCEEAEQKLKFHLQSLQSSGNHNKSMGLLFTLGRLYFSQKNYTEAEPYYKKAADLSKDLSLEPIVISALTALYWESGRDEDAAAQEELLKKSSFIPYTDSHYLQTKLAQLDTGIGRYEIELELKRQPGVRLPPMLGEGAVLEVHFQHPDPTQPALVVDHEIRKGETLVRVKSPDAPNVPFDPKAWYAFVVFVYEDSTKQNKLGVHHQLLLDQKTLLRGSRGTYTV